jgi:UDP-N-acetyl-D-mannosaminuronic acid dehydrogenase
VVAVLGLTYKPNVDDLRESPALAITQQLLERSHALSIYEPYAALDKKAWPEHASFVTRAQELHTADIIVCLVKHSIFYKIPQELLAQKIVLDFCGLFYTPTTVEHPAARMHTKLSYHNALKLKELLQ